MEEKRSGYYTFTRKQVLNTDLETAWNFISVPANLSRLTPPAMKMTVLSDPGDLYRLYLGQLIKYSVSPLPWTRFRWTTRISVVERMFFFTDEQLHGPFSCWQHTHSLRETGGGTEMTDRVHYRMPGWWLGKLAHSLFVRQELEKLFEYRRLRLEEMFGSGTATN
jgi:ligand-binding SRPBCC domain-containing protein